MPAATVFQSPRFTFVQPIGETSDGISIGVAPIAVLPRGLGLGQAVLDALKLSETTVIPRISNWRNFQPPLRAVPEFRNAERRPGRLRACSVSRNEDSYSLTPMNRSDRYNYGFVTDSTVRLPHVATTLDIEQALQALFNTAPALT
jgi:hypothetical protein